ncbi:MAG: spore protease YyaC [Lachnospiraceae bacterium]|nr:spore protease YyaC [Lachnospiraceae bacterium]
MSRRHSVYYFNTQEEDAFEQLGLALSSMISVYHRACSEFVILCIGTDRVTGDSLGPLIGYKLSRINLDRIYVYGTLDCPVHAQNLDETLAIIHEEHPNIPIIAIDASLGNKKHLGYITLGKGPLLPGAGVNKDLTAVGDICITGIVNTSGLLEHMLLQTTRLSTVMNLADCIAKAIHFAYFDRPKMTGRIGTFFHSLTS